MAFNNTEANEYINWIEEAISKKHIDYYEFEHFKNLQSVSTTDIGKIYRANWKNWRQEYGLKSLSNLDDIAVKELVNELKLHHKVNFHDNIINFYGITIPTSTAENQNRIEKYLLVTDFADGGSLGCYLKNNFNQLTWKNKYELAIQLTSVVSFLHHEGIVHRNLHSGSVLVHQGRIKIADFGLSRRIKEITSQQLFGVIPYIEPQKFGGKMAHPSLDEKKSDVYSIGVLLWEISSGKPPFCASEVNNSILGVKIFQGYREKVFPGTPTNYVSIYTECWDSEPDNRPSIHDVVVKLKSNFSRAEKKIIISKTIECIFKITNIGKGKKALFNYFNNNKIEFLSLYNWLLNNHLDVDSIFLLGYFYFHGIGSEINYEKAFNLFSNASEQNHILALYYVGICYQNGHGTIKNERLAFECFKVLAEKGYAMGQFKLGYLFNQRIETSEEAIYWYEMASNNSHIIAMYNLGRKYFYKGEYEKAVELFEISANEEHLDGITMMGYVCEYGIGTNIDCQKAAELYQKAATLGSKTAQCNIALMYQNGSGIERDLDKAIFWYKQSAEQGDQDAQDQLMQLENS